MSISAWKRRSWRYRLIVLVALAPLLQGCFLTLNFDSSESTYDVPGVGEVFYRRDTSGGDYAYVLKVIDPATGRYVRIRPGDPRFPIIDAFFRDTYAVPQNPPDRAGVPGGGGSLPPPAVQ
jgi:hypothetical protein